VKFGSSDSRRIIRVQEIVVFHQIRSIPAESRAYTTPRSDCTIQPIAESRAYTTPRSVFSSDPIDPCRIFWPNSRKVAPSSRSAKIGFLGLLGCPYRIFSATFVSKKNLLRGATFVGGTKEERENCSAVRHLWAVRHFFYCSEIHNIQRWIQPGMFV
jgi:hypothetical protein